MNTIVKIKVAIVLALGVLGFGVLGWRFFQPDEPGAAISFAADGINWAGVGMGIFLAVVLSGLGTVLGGSQGIHIGPLTVPAGLIALSIRSGGMERLLIEHVGESRSAMFYGMMGEALFWGFLVAIGFLVARVIRVIRITRSEETAGSRASPPELDKRGSGKGGKGHSTTRPGGGLLDGQMSSRWMSGLMATGFCCIVTLLLLLILMQSETRTLATAGNIQVGSPPGLKQILLASGIAFFLGALASHQLFEVRLGWFLLCPVLVSLLVYALGAYKGVLPVVDVPPQFVPRSVLFSTALPLPYVGVGMLTAIMGYWYSVEMYYHRRARQTSV